MSKQPIHSQPDTENACQVKPFVSVVIVGAGPTGLTAANLLGMAGIDTLVVEHNLTMSSYPKAISLDDEGLRICQAMGLSTAINTCILSGLNAHYVSAGRLLAKVAPTSKRNGYPLISTFYQPEFEASLLNGLKRFASVNVQFQHTIETFEQSDTGVIVSIRTPAGTLQRVECAYLLACDGGRSTIRHILNIPMKGTAGAQKWLVIDCIDDQESAAIATFFCNPRRPAVSVPSPHHGRRWEFMLFPDETEKELLAEEKIATLIHQAGGPAHPRIIRQTVYTFHATLAQSFSQGRVFLLGDAAHMMPPFGGQGLNSGLRDAHNLCWKLAMVLQGLAAPPLLDTYHEERYKHVAQMILFSSFLGSIVTSTMPLLAFCRNGILHTLNTMPPIRAFLTEARIKPQPRYKKGFFLANGSKEGKAMIGRMLPQPEVTTLEGQCVLLDEILGPGFALLRRHSDPRQAFASLNTDFWERLGARFVCIQPSATGRAFVGNVPPYLPSSNGYTGMDTLPLTVVCSDDKEFLCTSQDYFVVVRPDRYILGVFKEEKADMFVSSLQRLLQPTS